MNTQTPADVLRETLRICEEKSEKWLAEAQARVGRSDFTIAAAKVQAALEIAVAIKAIAPQITEGA